MASAQVFSKAACFAGALREHGIARAVPVPALRRSRSSSTTKRQTPASSSVIAHRRHMSVQAASSNGTEAAVVGLPIDLRGASAHRSPAPEPKGLDVDGLRNVGFLRYDASHQCRQEGFHRRRG